jgi:hypothetical protein
VVLPLSVRVDVDCSSVGNGEILGHFHRDGQIAIENPDHRILGMDANRNSAVWPGWIRRNIGSGIGNCNPTCFVRSEEKSLWHAEKVEM